MSELKATPGEWVYRKKTQEIGTIDRSDTQSYGMMLVIAHVDAYDHPEHEANAHLMRSAKELYEALDEAAKDLVAAQWNARRAALSDPLWEGVAETIQPRIDRARSALKKARGSS